MSSQRVWFVTGSSSGFGRLIVEHALSQNYKVVATLRTPFNISDLASKHPNDLLVLPLDVTDPKSISSAFSEAKAKFGHVDVVVNNAGSLWMGEVESVEEKDARSMFEVNFWGMTRVGKEAVRFFREENEPKGGVLFNVSSCLGVAAEPVAGHYSASKAATEAFFEAFAAELDPKWNITIQMLNPGTFHTDINHGDNANFADIHPAYKSLPSSHRASQNRTVFTEMASGKDFGVPMPEEFVKRVFIVAGLLERKKDGGVSFNAPIGADSLMAFKTKSEGLKKAFEEFEALSEGLKMPSPQ